MSAATVTQSAVSKDDWELVSSKWENAIFLLKELSNSSPNYVEAQVKIQEYGKNLNYARKQLDLPPLTEPNEESSTDRLTSVPSVAALATPQATAVTTSVSRPSQVTPPVNRVGSIALGLGALVAFGLINQKMGGGAVQVSSYHKKNGTFVHSQTRHRPR
jgi:hypothetical protein